MFAVALAMLAQVVAGTPVGWKTYTNQSFGYKTCYPGNMSFIKETMTPDGGSVISGQNNVSFYAENNTRGRSLNQYVNSLRDGSHQTKTRVTGNNEIIEEGSQPFGAFWRKSFRSGSRFITIEVDTANAKAYDYMVKNISACTTVR